MKNRKLAKDWDRELHKEIVIFYSICGQKDRAFFDALSKERKAEDYKRLFCIALSFGFKKLALQIIGNAGEPEIWLDKSSINGQMAIKWFDNFIANIPIPEFKELAIEVWNEERKKIETEEEFDIRSLFD